MKPLRWPTEREEAAYMRMRKEENIARSKDNPNELWMASRLVLVGHQWSRQATWGYRIYDFWCHELGVAVEVDGPEHDYEYDHHRDEYNFRRSGIVVLHVRNLNEQDVLHALIRISKLNTWEQRRHQLGLDAHTKKGRRVLVNYPDDISLLDEYLLGIDRIGK